MPLGEAVVELRRLPAAVFRAHFPKLPQTVCNLLRGRLQSVRAPRPWSGPVLARARPSAVRGAAALVLALRSLGPAVPTMVRTLRATLQRGTSCAC